MKTTDSRIAVYYAMPLCKTCNKEVSMIRRVAEQEKASMQVKFSIWKRIMHGWRFMSMPVVVVDGSAYSVLGAFTEESLTAELRGE